MGEGKKEEKKNFIPEFRSYSTCARKFRKKKLKKFKKLKGPFPALFLAKTDNIGREREKKILVTNSVHTRPGQENSKKNSKKIQEIKKTLSGIIFSQNRMR